MQREQAVLLFPYTKFYSKRKHLDAGRGGAIQFLRVGRINFPGHIKSSHIMTMDKKDDGRPMARDEPAPPRQAPRPTQKDQSQWARTDEVCT